MRRLLAIVGPAIVVVALAIPAPVAAVASECGGYTGNLLTNCGFESGSTTGWTLSGDTRNAAVTAASLHSGSYGFVAGPPWPYTNTYGTILSQTVSTTVGHAYIVRLWYEAAIAPTTYSSSLQVFVYDGATEVAGVGTSYQNAAWYQWQGAWISTSTSATLTLNFWGGDTGRWYFDDVVLVEVPDMTGTTATKSKGKVTVNLDSLVTFTQAECLFAGRNQSWQSCSDGAVVKTSAKYVEVRGLGTNGVWGPAMYVPVTRA